MVGDEFVLPTKQRSVTLQQITLKLGNFNNLKAFLSMSKVGKNNGKGLLEQKEMGIEE